MASIWEPEEFVGALWHRLVGNAVSYPRHPEAAVGLDDMRMRLGVLFRALGGPGAVRIAATAAESSGHRLGLKQRLGLGTEKLDRARYDGATLQLPDRLDVFPVREDNAGLYEWLAAFFAHAEPPPMLPVDLLQADLARLRAARGATDRALAAWPGLRVLHERLCRAMRAARPRRRLPAQEAAVESVVLALLGAEGKPADARFAAMLAVVIDGAMPLDAFRADPGYRPFLPVPLWGEVSDAVGAGLAADGDEEGGGGAEGDGKRRKAKRRDTDQTRRDDPLMLNRFEKILGLAEMVNLNRKVEDDDEENARKAAEDMDEITVGQHERKASAKLKLDLDLAAEEVDAAPLRAEITYPEWDWKRRRYLPDHCRVIAEPAALEGEEWRPDDYAIRRIRLVRRQFEAMRPRRQLMTGQPDGDDLDLSALVRSVADRQAGGYGSERVYSAVRTVARDLSVCVLVDVSLSTDSYVEERRVLDVEKEALLALTHGLAACGDEHAILTFTSHRRQRVDVRTVKDFEERLDARVVRRIQALKPGSYTRMGAALRHATFRLKDRPHTHRLLLVLTDGKPNDTDHYEGRHAIEDTRVAVQEARRAGLRLFGITVDEQGRDYLPYIFGTGAYAIFPHVARLPAALPAIYRQLTC
ncbi:VWA domain-containing protein [Azospirillum sp. BE72]|uniref:nitric oxide reductase activation protein NorD n=1 Tax=Azospirillum sp. BE72 TaxID=2817776 RepID=UPI002855CDB3|nr:VWA domain-containing protein [Azospirillum sp. BE72]MDR6772355.1 nitric oxide reductase NorD protein [Azospirillum sp. BE72]